MKQNITFDSPVSALSGVAPDGAREKQLHKLGIYTVGELLEHYPRAYENRGDVKNISDEPDGEPHSYLLTVVTAANVTTIRKGMSILKFRAADDSGTAEICFFNQYYLKSSFPVGARMRFYGKTVRERGGVKLYSPVFEPIGAELASVVPIYGTTSGLSQKVLSSLVKKATDALLPHVHDFLPDTIRRERELSTLCYAYENIHFPENEEALERARRRLIYDEFFLFAVRMKLAREEMSRGHTHPFEKTDMSPYTSSLGYELTGAQKRAISEIEADLCSDVPMCRIVVGDVGCGKTAIAAAAAYMTFKNGRQCVLMAPTEILARQHYSELSETLGALGMKVSLLVGSMKATEKRAALGAASGKTDRADLVIGTHALIEDNVIFDSLGLVITDEQHRFGAMQRAKLAEKGGDAVNTLVMSATPIPRTLSLVMYGDLDISVIDEMPPGRQIVDTFAVDEGYRPRLYAFMRKQIENGNQVYVVCPAVGGDEDGATDEYRDPDAPTLKAATEYAKELSEHVFPDIKVGFVHGKMKGAEKDAVMSAFASGEIKILVSTTVIEVGVNVPNATLMVIENAERFGLSQLHQLRGRVGRGRDKSYCVLVSKASKSEGTPAYERLMTMKKEHNGFAIAEKDLSLRGPGDFLPQNGSVRQSGSASFRLACLDDEDGMLWLKRAFADAAELLSDKDALSLPENAELARRVSSGNEHDRSTIS